MNNSVTIAIASNYTSLLLPWMDQNLRILMNNKKVQPNSLRTSSYFDSTCCDDCVIKGTLDQ
ncbi:hypothetical protein Tco_1096564, partial [Tanacetum coccineum]